MLLTRVGSMFAWIAFVVGVLMMSQDLLIEFSDMGRDAVTQVIGSRTNGHLIMSGTYCALFGIGIDVLTRMCRAGVSKTMWVAGSHA